MGITEKNFIKTLTPTKICLLLEWYERSGTGGVKLYEEPFRQSYNMFVNFQSR